VQSVNLRGTCRGGFECTCGSQPRHQDQLWELPKKWNLMECRPARSNGDMAAIAS